MATTNKGIYYPTDYTKVADVPADMKALAESVDTAIENSKYDDTAIKQDISNIEQDISEINQEQNTQNTNISANTTKNAEQDSLIQKLKDNMINLTTEEDTSLYITDAGTPPAKLTIRGNHRQATREGYNLVKIGNYNTSFDGITFESNLEEGWISATGTSTGASAPIATVTLPAGDYVFSGGPANGSASTQRLSIYKNEAGTFNNVYTLYGDRTYTVNITEETTFRFNYVIPEGVTVNNEKIYPMIVSGTETKPFQVYGVMPSVEYPSEIETVKNEVNVVVTNKNLYKITASNKTDAGVTFTVNEDGTVVANGTSTGTYLNLGEIYLDAGTYTVSGGPANGDWNKQRLTLYLYKGPTENYSIYRNMTYTFTLTERTRVSLAYVAQSGSVLNNEVIKPMIEYGTVATDFIKHEEIKKTLDIQQEMLKGDYFDLENDKEVCGFKKKIFTGTETISATVNGNSFSYIASDILADTNTIKIPKIYSNCYSACSWQDRNTNNKPNTVSAYNITIGFDKGNFATVEEFKAELAKRYSEGNPVYVIYPLAENEELDLTETQKQQLTQLDNLDLFKGINNIYTEEGIALMQLDYSADTKMYIDNLVTQNTAESEG